MREIIVPNLPPPNGHYSHAVISKGQLYMSGILPNLVKPQDSLDDQFEAVFKVIREVLGFNGVSLQDVVTCRVYVADINDWPRINELYAKAFGNHRPARVVVPVKELHFGYKLEVELMAEMPQ